VTQEIPPPFTGPRKVPPRVVELRGKERHLSAEIHRIAAKLAKELNGEDYADPERVRYFRAMLVHLRADLASARAERESIQWSCYGFNREGRRHGVR
jgi:hypothetical protein